MRLVTLEQLLQLHAIVILQTGGSDGLRNLGRLEAVIATQNQKVFGEELYKGLFEKAAAMCRGIIGGHPFVDGNKRTGMLTAMTLLGVNGYMFTIKPGEVEDFAVKVAVERLEIRTIAAWLKAHSKKA